MKAIGTGGSQLDTHGRLRHLLSVEGLSRELQGLCDYMVKIPTRFSVNLGIAGALVMYDRLRSLGRFAERPVGEGGPHESAPLPAFGEPLYKKRARQRAARARASA